MPKMTEDQIAKREKAIVLLEQVKTALNELTPEGYEIPARYMIAECGRWVRCFEDTVKYAKAQNSNNKELK